MSSYDFDPATGLPRQRQNQQRFGRPDPWMFSQGLASPQTPYNPASGSGVPGLPPSISIPGTKVDYRSLIDNDPLFKQLKADLSAQGVQDAASRAAQTQRALVMFGQVPQFDALSGLNPDWLNQDVTDQTRQLAQQNTDAGLSLAARQQQAFKDQVRQIRNALAARGALRSGETGHALQEAQRSFDQGKYDASQELMDFISGLQAGFAQSERARIDAQRGGAEQAAGRVPDQPQQPAVTAGAVAGSGLYYGTDGNLYNPDGTLYSQPVDPGDPNVRPAPRRGIGGQRGGYLAL